MSNDAGEVIWRADIRPVGQSIASTEAYPVRFDGQAQEAELGDQGGLIHLGARLYDPLAGRFLGADPLPLANVGNMNPLRFNRYAYALNNPFRYADPTGYQEESAFAWATRLLKHPDVEPYTRLLLKESYLRKGEAAWAAIQREFSHLTYSQLEAWAKGMVEPLAKEPGFNRALLDEAAAANALRRALPRTRLSTVVRGKGGVVGAVITVALIVPGVAEAASEEKYGTAILEAISIVWPRDQQELNSMLACFGLCASMYAPPQQFDALRDFNEWWSGALDEWLAKD
jgi:RHS repeat-associated protein